MYFFWVGTHINMWDECVNKWIKWGYKYLCVKKVQLSQLFQLIIYINKWVSGCVVEEVDKVVVI